METGLRSYLRLLRNIDSGICQKVVYVRKHDILKTWNLINLKRSQIKKTKNARLMTVPIHAHRFFYYLKSNQKPSKNDRLCRHGCLKYKYYMSMFTLEITYRHHAHAY